MGGWAKKKPVPRQKSCPASQSEPPEPSIQIVTLQGMGLDATNPPTFSSQSRSPQEAQVLGKLEQIEEELRGVALQTFNNEHLRERLNKVVIKVRTQQKACKEAMQKDGLFDQLASLDAQLQTIESQLAGPNGVKATPPAAPEVGGTFIDAQSMKEAPKIYRRRSA